MKAVNTVTLLGYMSERLESKNVPTKNGEMQVVKFGLGTPTFEKSAEGKREKGETDWHNIVVWGDLGQIVATKGRKGAPVLVVGRLQQDDYTDKNGVKKTRYDVIANEVTFVGAVGTGFNQVLLLGHLGRSPELRSTATGTQVADFSLATNRYKGKDSNGQALEETDWHNIVAWAGLATLATERLQKGSPVLVIGRLQNRSWQDNNSEKKYKTEVVANNLIFQVEQVDSSEGEVVTPEVDEGFPF